jgi:hypothetical protein
VDATKSVSAQRQVTTKLVAQICQVAAIQVLVADQCQKVNNKNFYSR